MKEENKNDNLLENNNENSPLINNNTSIVKNPINNLKNMNPSQTTNYSYPSENIMAIIYMILSCIFNLFTIILSNKFKDRKDTSYYHILMTQTFFLLFISIISLKFSKVNLFNYSNNKKGDIYPVFVSSILGINSMCLYDYSLSFLNNDFYTIFYFYPVLVMLLGYFFLKEKLKIFDFIFLIISYYGLILIVKQNLIYRDLNTTLFPVFCVIFKSIQYLIIRKLGKNVHFLTFPFFYALVGLIIFSYGSLLVDKISPTFTWDELRILFLSALFTFLYQIFMILGLQNEIAGRVSIINYIQIAFMFLDFKSFNEGGTIIILANIINLVLKIKDRKDEKKN